MYKILSLILIGATLFSCQGNQSSVVTVQSVEFGIDYAVEVIAPQLVAKNIESSGLPAYRAWGVIKVSIDDVLIPALFGDRIQIDDLNSWLDLINDDVSIGKAEADALQTIINMILGLIDTDAVDSVFKQNQQLEEIQRIVLKGFTSFSEVLAVTLSKYSKEDFPAGITNSADVRGKSKVQFVFRG